MTPTQRAYIIQFMGGPAMREPFTAEGAIRLRQELMADQRSEALDRLAEMDGETL